MSTEATSSTLRRPLWPAFILVALAWGAAAFDYHTRNSQSAENGAVQAYGWTAPSSLYISVDGSKIELPADKFKLILIAPTDFANIDRMTDTVIAKSPTYTITNDPITLGIVLPRLRINSGQVNTIEFDLVGLPMDFSPDQIASLSDVAKIGGKIIAHVGKSDLLTGAPTVAPSAVTP